MNKTRTNLFRVTVSISISFLLISCFFQKENSSSKAPNTLSKKEIKAGWTLLWDGKSFNGWRGIYKDNFPVQGWIIETGELICLGNEMPDSLKGGDIITEKKYGSFELTCQFKITEKGNSGIKYFVNESLKASAGHGLGLEYAILDNENWPYDKPDYNRTCGSLYDLVRAPEKIKVQAKGEWNEALIIVKGNHIEHWLNGIKSVEIEKGSEQYQQILSKSKYANLKGRGEFQDGHILLQDGGPRTSFRNIKIREIKN